MKKNYATKMISFVYGVMAVAMSFLVAVFTFMSIVYGIEGYSTELWQCIVQGVGASGMMVLFLYMLHDNEVRLVDNPKYWTKGS
jgi:archaellum biogenesis protein FlaJ (TadC family)